MAVLAQISVRELSLVARVTRRRVPRLTRVVSMGYFTPVHVHSLISRWLRPMYVSCACQRGVSADLEPDKMLARFSLADVLTHPGILASYQFSFPAPGRK